MYIFMIRHGETDWNKRGIVQGRTDIPSNDTGIKQAKELADVFENMHFSALITSSLKRAVDTGAYICEKAEVDEILCDNRIIERCFGVVEGIEVVHFIKEFKNKEIEGAETMGDVQARMYMAISDYAQRYPDNVLVVSHGHVIGRLLERLCNGEQNTMRLKNTSISIIEKETLKMVAFNLDKEEAKAWIQEHGLR